MWATQRDKVPGSESWYQDTDRALNLDTGSGDESLPSTQVRRDHKRSMAMALLLILHQGQRMSQRDLSPLQGKDCPGGEASEGTQL